jgi:glucose-fructose oxidoreductase
MAIHHSEKETPRRQFLKQLAAGVGATTLGLAKPFNIVQAAHRIRSKDQLGIALVGLGYYSTDLLAPALQETKEVKLAGIVTGTPAKAESWSAKYAIPSANIYDYANYDAIAQNPDIDIIYVVLPNSMHAEYTIRAARAGKHVICEKPMALNAGECRTMIQACKEANRILSIGYRMQYEPTTQEIMRYAEEKALGDIMFVTAGAGYRESRAGNWKVTKSMGGGAMMDMGVYSLQAARYATGEEPVSVTAQTFTNRPEIFKDVDETTSFQLECPSGAVANCHTSHGLNMNYLDVRCQQGWYKLDPFQAYRGIKGESSRGPLDFPVINQQATQMDEVARCIMDEKPLRVAGEEGLRDMIVVEAIYKSIATGDKVML